MELIGLCHICGKPGTIFTCRLCGKLVCAVCFNNKYSICKNCMIGKQ